MRSRSRPRKRARTYSRRRPKKRTYRRTGRRNRSSGYKLTVRNPRVNRFLTTRGPTVRDAFVKFYYNDTVNLTQTTSANSSIYITINANDIWDPATYIGNSKVANYNLLLGQFSQFTVVGCKIEVRFISESDFAKQVCITALKPGTAASSSIWTDNNVRNNTVTAIVPNRKAGNSQHVLKMFRKTKDMVEEDLDDPKLSGTYAPTGTNPATRWYYAISVQNPPIAYASSTLANFYGQVRVTYYTRLRSAIQPVQ